jgi:hypothetical protein
MPIQYPADQASTFQAQDFTMFLTKTVWNRCFYVAGTVDNSPDVNFYLKDEKGSQAIYVPEGSSCVVRWTAIYNIGGTLVAGESETGTITRANAGNVTYTGAAIGSGSGNFTVTPTANTTVQCVELVASDSDSEQATRVIVFGEFYNLPFFMEAFGVAGANSTAALTTAEV